MNKFITALSLMATATQADLLKSDIETWIAAEIDKVLPNVRSATLTAADGT